VIFFKLGKFYEIFHADAILCHKELNLAWMDIRKCLHVGFPEKMLDKYIQVLIDLGYKIAVVEATETTREAARRKEAADPFHFKRVEAKDKVVNR
jgi:DNA mismatch repair protein MutS